MCMFNSEEAIVDGIISTESNVIMCAIINCGYELDWLKDNSHRIKAEIKISPFGNEDYEFKVDNETKFIVHRICEMSNDSYNIKWVVDMKGKK